MQSGTLGAYTLLGGAGWYKRRSITLRDGEAIVSKPLGGEVYLDGFRCRKCRLLLLSY